MFASLDETNVKDHKRSLGIIEALTAVRDQCPHGGIREHAARALDVIGADGSRVLRQQTSLVLSTISGWRGERAEQVKSALRAFLGDEKGGSGKT